MIIASSFNRNKFTIFRRADNSLDFLIRDIDRQPVAPAGILELHLWDAHGTEVLTETLQAVNAAKGHYRVIVNVAETIPLATGEYRWSVVNTVSGSPTLLFADRDYTVHGVVTVLEGIYESLPPVITVEPSDMSFVGGTYRTSTYEGAAKALNPTGNHTVIPYLVNYTGTLTIQGSLDSTEPQADNHWTAIETRMFVAETSNAAVHFYGNYTYVRFLVTSTTGLTKLVYRN